ncbi:CDGSH iron-sulfur domain-containing protein [Tepidiforma sp.]|uniref:CDGSH iron-sulfur domain-containing protein n=1 Tax=Tepidiforma sp. TaxID=2682230 RepID=UPI002ADE0433|nr:CDGSH iron-sulfur domain-containing protein [Tepidiforma sp.]
MSDVTIQVRDNGPYVVRGSFVVTDAEGNQFEKKDVVALCRCGHSATKPFCDGAHNREGFSSTPRAGQS